MTARAANCWVLWLGVPVLGAVACCRKRAAKTATEGEGSAKLVNLLLQLPKRWGQADYVARWLR